MDCCIFYGGEQRTSPELNQGILAAELHYFVADFVAELFAADFAEQFAAGLFVGFVDFVVFANFIFVNSVNSVVDWVG